MNHEYTLLVGMNGMEYFANVKIYSNIEIVRDEITRLLVIEKVAVIDLMNLDFISLVKEKNLES